MMKNKRLYKRVLKDGLIGIVIGLALSMVLVKLGYAPSAAQAGQPFTVQDIAAAGGSISLPLTAQSSPADILALMRQSYQKWQTFEGEATTVYRDEQTGKETAVISRIQIEQFGKVRLEVDLPNAPLSRVFVSDGTTVSQEDRDRGVYTQYPVPANMQSLQKSSPPAAPAATDQFVVPHPMEGLIPSEVAGDVFPVGLGQSMRPKEVTVVGEDIVAGRKTVIIRWLLQNAGTIAKKHQYWIDAQTGLILKAELYELSKDGWSTWAMQTIFTKAQYDQPSGAEMFVFHPSATSQQLSQAQFDQ